MATKQAWSFEVSANENYDNAAWGATVAVAFVVANWGELFAEGVLTDAIHLIGWGGVPASARGELLIEAL